MFSEHLTHAAPLLGHGENVSAEANLGSPWTLHTLCRGQGRYQGTDERVVQCQAVLSKDKAGSGNAEGQEVFAQMKQPGRVSTRRRRVSGGLNEARGRVVDADGGDF